MRAAKQKASWGMWARVPSSALLCQYLADDLRRGRDYQPMLDGVYPLLELLQSFARPAFDLLRQDRLAAVDLGGHVVYHGARPVVLELAGLEVVVRTLDGVRAVIGA